MTAALSMDDDIILRVTELGKLYARSARDSRSRMGATAVRAFFNLKAPAVTDLSSSEFWAVKNISFELRRGEALGIIGLNGSGKTTLLRMLAAQIVPDAGEVRTMGTTAAMIDLQAGFQNSASGRNNIYLRSAALGFSKQETDQRLSEIIEFSELGTAIDAPISTYSSGMRMRLAFSIMVTVAPDILFIDEILAVGDFKFRQKCLGKIREMRARSAFVFVSHSMGDVQRFCDRVMVLHKGRIVFFGEAADAVRFYLEEIDKQNKDIGPVDLATAVKPQFELNHEVIEHIDHFWANANGERVERYPSLSGLRLICEIGLRRELRQLSIGVPIWAQNGTYLSGFASRETYSKGLPHQVGRNRYELTIPDGFFGPGIYHSNLVIRDGVEYLYRKLNPPIIVDEGGKHVYGYFALPHSWSVDE